MKHPDHSQFPPMLGYRAGNKGTHTSRTMMLAELSALFACTEPSATKENYFEEIIEFNCLGKSTTATRKLTAQRLSELYALDHSVAIYRLLRTLFDFDPTGQPLTAFLVALARDPLLRATIPSVQKLAPNQIYDREAMKSLLRAAVGERLNDSTLDKVVRNAGSSWTQAGHLEGRTMKKRRLVEPTAGPVIMALFLGYLQGLRGTSILNTCWCQTLDAEPDQIARIASTASLSGLLRFRKAGDVIEVGFPDLLTPNEIKLLHVSH
jgi:hypothetical protein